MASNIKATPQEEEVPEKQVPETAPDSPLLDLSDVAVKKLVRSAKKRGYVTHDQINPRPWRRTQAPRRCIARFRWNRGSRSRHRAPPTVSRRLQSSGKPPGAKGT